MLTGSTRICRSYDRLVAEGVKSSVRNRHFRDSRLSQPDQTKRRCFFNSILHYAKRAYKENIIGNKCPLEYGLIVRTSHHMCCDLRAVEGDVKTLAMRLDGIVALFRTETGASL